MTAPSQVMFFVSTVLSALNTPIVIEGGTERVSRYARSYYVTALDAEDAREIIVLAEQIDDASVTEVDQPKCVRLSEVPTDIRAVLEEGRGVSWRSGRAFFVD